MSALGVLMSTIGGSGTVLYAPTSLEAREWVSLTQFDRSLRGLFPCETRGAASQTTKKCEGKRNLEGKKILGIGSRVNKFRLKKKGRSYVILR